MSVKNLSPADIVINFLSYIKKPCANTNFNQKHKKLMQKFSLKLIAEVVEALNLEMKI